VGLRFVDGRGEVVEWSGEKDAELLRAGRVSLGLLGMLTSITLRVLPAFRLLALRSCMPIESCLDQLDELIAQHAYLDFYWYPRRDEADVRAKDPTMLTADDVPASRERRVGWMRDVIPNTRTLKFNEMEYAVPRLAGPECFRAVRRRIKERHRRTVAWRVLYRTVAAEDAYLSPSFERDSVTISIHQNAHLPYREFFTDIEPIFRSYDGRPHWAKINTLRPDELRELYPRWEDFSAIRNFHDPQGRFLNRYFRELFE
jgi:FAD/FMN-containing dehydrogenase